MVKKKSRGGAERPSKKMLTKAAKTLRDDDASKLDKQLAAVVLGEGRKPKK